MSAPILQVTTSMLPAYVSGRCRDGRPAGRPAAAAAATVHAVAVLRDPAELTGEPELAVCGAMVTVDPTPWSAAPMPSCPACRSTTGSVRRPG